MDTKTIRHTFSRLGLMYFLGTIIILVVQIAADKLITSLFPQILDNYSVYFTVVELAQFFLAYPLMILLIRRVPADSAPAEKHRMSVKQWLVAFLMCYAAMYLSNLVGTLLTTLIGAAKGSAVNNVIFNVTTNLHPVVLFLFMVVGAPIAEEYIFRKLLIDRVAVYGEGVAILLSATVFALIHGNLNQAVYAFAIGAFFAYIYVRTREIKYTIAMHACINFLGSVVAMWIINVSGYLELATALESAASEEETMQLVMEHMSGLMIFGIYAILLLVMVCAGIAMLIINRKKFYLQTAPCELPAHGRFAIVFLNLGMGLLCIYCLAQMILQLFGISF